MWSNSGFDRSPAVHPAGGGGGRFVLTEMTTGVVKRETCTAIAANKARNTLIKIVTVRKAWPNSNLSAVEPSELARNSTYDVKSSNLGKRRY
jgi:hypothetical protein